MYKINMRFRSLKNLRNSSSYCVAHAQGSQTLLRTCLWGWKQFQREEVKKVLSALKILLWVKFSVEMFSIIP